MMNGTETPSASWTSHYSTPPSGPLLCPSVTPPPPPILKTAEQHLDLLSFGFCRYYCHVPGLIKIIYDYGKNILAVPSPYNNFSIGMCDQGARIEMNIPTANDNPGVAIFYPNTSIPALLCGYIQLNVLDFGVIMFDKAAYDDTTLEKMAPLVYQCGFSIPKKRQIQLGIKTTFNIFLSKEILYKEVTVSEDNINLDLGQYPVNLPFESIYGVKLDKPNQRVIFTMDYDYEIKNCEFNVDFNEVVVVFMFCGWTKGSALLEIV